MNDITKLPYGANIKSMDSIDELIKQKNELLDKVERYEKALNRIKNLLNVPVIECDIISAAYIAKEAL